MNLIIISKDDFFDEETVIVNKLFEAGLTHFHLRKPYATEQNIKSFLHKIAGSHRNKIALHQFHNLAHEMGISRLHFTTKNRHLTSKIEIDNLVNMGYKLSTSLHSFGEINNIDDAYSYSFLSPVFNSISKPNYLGIFENNLIIPKAENLGKIYALGGIDLKNIDRIKEMRFKGAAVLGSIWKNPNEAVSTYLKLKEVCQ